MSDCATAVSEQAELVRCYKGPGSRLATVSCLAGLSFAALLLHGYHPGAEDAEIYLPGVLKLIHPDLFPRGAEFFESHASMTLFPRIIAASVRLTHLHVGVAVMAWYGLSIFLTLAACYRIGRLCFSERRPAWCGTALVASLLTLPVAGTALYIADPYLTSRSLSTPAALFAVAFVLSGNRWAATLLLGITAAVHPLMAVFALAFAAIVVVLQLRPRLPDCSPAFGAIVLLPAVTPAYREILKTRPYFLLTNWAWYEWLGVFAPLLLLLWFAALGRRNGLERLTIACRALLVLGLGCLAIELVIGVPGRFENLAELQLMRSLHLIYVLFFLFAGALLGKFVLRGRPLRWVVLFLPVCTVMFVAQRHLFASTDHVEWPGSERRNPWVQAFVWIRRNTPTNAYFALDPDYNRLPQNDEQGFRAVSHRSMLADADKDAGAVSMFPALADEWSREVAERRRWRDFGLSDFERLKSRDGVSWAVVMQPGIAGLDCRYSNRLLRVCRIP